MRNNALFALWRPHLVIYLDVPVDETRRRIEARNLPNEKDSMLTTPAYLQALVDSYKKDYLKDIRYFFIISPEEFSYFNKSFIDTWNSTHAEVLVYDWSKVADPEIVVEDIERIDFDQYTVYDEKMKDWRRINEWDWNNSRQE